MVLSNVLVKYYVIPSIIFIICIILFCKKRYVAACVLLAALGVFIFIIPLPVRAMFHDFNQDVKYPVLTRGNWVTLYKLSNSIVLKVYSSPGVTYKDFTLVKELPTPFKKFYRNGSFGTLPCIIASSFMLERIMRSEKRKMELFEKNHPASQYFAKIFELSEENKYAISEFVPVPVSKVHSSINLEEQIMALDSHLRDLDLHLDDIHIDNVHINSSGHIKIIDGELFTRKELEHEKRYFQSIKRSAYKPSTLLRGCTNIYGPHTDLKALDVLY